MLCALNIAFGPAAAGKVKQGNRLYEKENYDEAVKKYTDAQIDMPESPELFFNIADILYKQRKFAEAEKMFEKSVPKADTGLEAKIYYNIGDCRYRQGDLRGSLDYYKKALELDPKDEDAKYNIEFVEKKIKEMISQSKERQEKQKQEQEKQGKQKKDEEKGGEEKKEGDREMAGAETQQAPSEAEHRQPEEMTQKETQAMEEKAKPEPERKEGREEEERKEEKEEKPATEETAGKPPQEKQAGRPKEMNKEEAESLLRMMQDEEKAGGRLEDKKKRTYYPDTEKPW